MLRISVVLPQPLGPSSPTTDPRGTSRDEIGEDDAIAPDDLQVGER